MLNAVVEEDDSGIQVAKQESTSLQRRRLKKPPPLQLSNDNLFVSSHQYEALGTFEVRCATLVGPSDQPQVSESCASVCMSPQELLTEFEWNNRVFRITHHGISLSSSVASLQVLRYATSNPRKLGIHRSLSKPPQEITENILSASLQQHLVITDEDAVENIGQWKENGSGYSSNSCSCVEDSRDGNFTDFSLCTNTNPNSGYKTQDPFFEGHHTIPYSQTEWISSSKHVVVLDSSMEANQRQEVNYNNNRNDRILLAEEDGMEQRYCPFPFHCLKLQGTIGIGTSSTVYKARRKGSPDNEAIAVKVLQVVTSHAQRKCLLRELRVLFYTYFHPHPNIVAFYGACFLDGQVFIGLEYMPMGTLRHILSWKKQVDENFARCVAFQVLCALEYLHEEIRCIHRDIKPGNILFGTQGQVKLCDFGLASKGFASSCKKHSFVGTTLYMAPELLRGEAYDTKVDIWSLGMTIREALGGGHPFRSILEESTCELDLFLQLEAAEGCCCPKEEEWNIAFHHGQDWSFAGRDFLAKCLSLHAQDRPSAKELLQHVWFEPLRTEASKNILGIPHERINWKDWQVAMRQVAQSNLMEALDWQQVRHHCKETSPTLWSA